TYMTIRYEMLRVSDPHVCEYSHQAMSNKQSAQRICVMVAPQLFDNDAQSASTSPPPSAPPPKKFRRGLLAAVAAVTIAGGAGSGALAATLVDHSTPTT